ncbi:MAG: sialidase family protein [Ilyomonas sp.]
MKKLLLIIIALVSISITVLSQQIIPVFVSGMDGYKSYRIPAIIRAPNNDLLAFCEGRVDNAADYGDVDIVMKRSTDGGKTWSVLKVIADNKTKQAGNPAPVVDRSDPAYSNGRIFLFYNTGNNNEHEVRKGNGLREVWYKTSTDNGETWSDAVNITLEVHKPKQPSINSAYNFTEDWRSYANTPGHAMQFEEGNYKGRMYVAANHSEGEPMPDFSDYKAHGFYTDDHGKTFHLSDNIPIDGSNEATAAALSNNRLMMNIRNQKGDIKSRIVAISNNGGVKWDRTYFDKQLPDPVCEGSILTIGKKKQENILAFCNNADTSIRDNLTLRISFNDGKTWQRNVLIDKTGAADNSAYSDIVQLDNKRIGILYEKNNYSSIVFTVAKW